MLPWILLLAADPLSLPDALRRAAAAHPSVAAARHLAGAAHEQAAETRALRLPRVDFAESFTRGDNPVYAFGTLLTQRQFTAANFALDALNRPDFVNNFQSLLRFEQPLFDAGRARFAAARAAAGEKAAQARVKLTEEHLLMATAQAYWDAWLAAEAVRAAAEAIRSTEASLVQAKAIRDAGRSTDADVLSVEVQLAQVQEERIARAAQERQALAALNEAIGAPLDTAWRLTTIPAETALAGAPAIPRPALAAQQAAIEQAEAAGKAARAALLPTVGLMGAFEADRQRFVTRAGANWLAGVTLRWTPFQGGADRARIRAAEAELSAAKAAGQATARRLDLEKHQSEQALQAAQARLATTEKSIAMAEESLRITRDRYSAGLAPVADVLRTEAALYGARLRRAAALHGLRLAQLAAVTAQGRLSPDSEIFQ